MYTISSSRSSKHGLGSQPYKCVILKCLSQQAPGRPPGFCHIKQFRGEKVHAHTSCSDSRVVSDRSCRCRTGRSSIRGQAADEPCDRRRCHHVEVGGLFWDPTPDIRLITSESLGIIGSTIDFVDDLGIEKKSLQTAQVVLRPGTEYSFALEVHADQ